LTNEIQIAHTKLGGNNPLFIIAGPCVIESEDIVFSAAKRLKEICSNIGLPLLFKSSYDKANRTSISSFRGPGLEKGLRVLSDVRSRFDIPVISDVHSVEEVKIASKVLDALQIRLFYADRPISYWQLQTLANRSILKKGNFLHRGMSGTFLINLYQQATGMYSSRNGERLLDITISL